MGGSKEHNIRPEDTVDRNKEQGASTEIGNTTLTLSLIFKSLSKIAVYGEIASREVSRGDGVWLCSRDKGSHRWQKRRGCIDMN
jgi:hypothetical protein